MNFHHALCYLPILTNYKIHERTAEKGKKQPTNKQGKKGRLSPFYGFPTESFIKGDFLFTPLRTLLPDKKFLITFDS